MVSDFEIILSAYSSSECDGDVHADGSERDDDYGSNNRKTGDSFQKHYWYIWESLYFRERIIYRGLGARYQMFRDGDTDVATAY